ncbi:MAG: corrinoid protein [Prevotella sp.]|jgi:5-methyltetrahydrofolate--homocysteine methyltransferase|nr:corrinoid protein [Prevotella sp.]
MNNEILNQLKSCIVAGKINAATPFPPEMKGMPGADELTKEALDTGISPSDIMNEALVPGMDIVGQRFTENKIFVPQMLISARAMNASMAHLKPYFVSGEVKRKGTFILGTILGDLHDIGKNLCGMMIEGAGWEVIDLGVDVSSEKFIDTLQKYPDAVIGISALLTTTMSNMGPAIQKIKEISPQTKVIVGGAPVSAEYASSIGADGFGRDPQESVKWLETLVA